MIFRLALISIFVTVNCFLVAPTALAQPVGGGGTPPPVGGGGTPPRPTTPAPTTPSGPSISLINPLGPGVGLPQLMNKILDFVIRIGAIVVTFMLIYVGFKFVIARGEPGEISKARQNLMWTLIGALILLGAEAIALGIEATVRALSSGS